MHQGTLMQRREEAGKARWTYWLTVTLLALLTMVYALRYFLPRLLRRDLFEDDLTQHVWWTYQFVDPALFPNDLLADFFSQPIFAPYGYQALYWLFGPFVDAQLIAESLPFVLAIPVVTYAFLIGHHVAGGTLLGGLVGGLYAITGEVLRDVQHGLPRSFAEPILLFGLWALFTRRQVYLGLALLCGALFYPPTVVHLGCLACVVLGSRVIRERTLPHGWLGLGALGLLAVGVLILAYARPLPQEMGPKLTAAEARTMPEFWPGGRNSFFRNDPVAFYIQSERAGFGKTPGTLAVWAVLVGGSIVLCRGVVPGVGWALLGTSLAGFVLAHMYLWTLHQPNRYVRYGLPLFGLIWATAVVPRLLAVSMRYRIGAQLVAWCRRPVVLVVCSGLLVAGAAAETVRHITTKLEKHPPPGQEEAYAFLATLPKTTLVAAHPLDADPIPLRSQRSVLASMETSLAYYKGYYQRVADRITDMLVATYALEWAEVDRLYERYGVDVFLVHRQRYTAAGRGYYPPFQTALHERLAQGDQHGFVLVDLPADRVLFCQGDYCLIRVGPPRALVEKR
jgi:hypothetical protein